MPVSGHGNLGDLSMWTKFASPQKWIDTLSPADGEPPQQLYAFIYWCLKGSYFAIMIGSIATIIAGCIEMLSPPHFWVPSLTLYWTLALKK